MNSQIVSPCVNVCAIDPKTGMCSGCARTLDEIACWASMSDHERQAIMRALPGRRARDMQRTEERRS